MSSSFFICLLFFFQDFESFSFFGKKLFLHVGKKKNNEEKVLFRSGKSRPSDNYRNDFFSVSKEKALGTVKKSVLIFFRDIFLSFFRSGRITKSTEFFLFRFVFFLSGKRMSKEIDDFQSQTIQTRNVKTENHSDDEIIVESQETRLPNINHNFGTAPIASTYKGKIEVTSKGRRKIFDGVRWQILCRRPGFLNEKKILDSNKT